MFEDSLVMKGFPGGHNSFLSLQLEITHGESESAPSSEDSLLFLVSLSWASWPLTPAEVPRTRYSPILTKHEVVSTDVIWDLRLVEVVAPFGETTSATAKAACPQ